MMLSIAMRTLFAICAGLAAAQTPILPSCAGTCLTQFQSGSSIAGCNSLDIACICSNQSFLGNIACCLAGQCSASDQQAATQYALSFCKAAGVTNLPTAVSCTSTSMLAITDASAKSVTSMPATTNASAKSVTSASSTATNSVASSHTSASTAAAATQTNGAGQRKSGVEVGLFGGFMAMVAFL